MPKQFVLIAIIMIMATLLAFYPLNSAFSQTDSNATDSFQEHADVGGVIDLGVIEPRLTPLGVLMRLVYPIIIGTGIVVTLIVWKRRHKRK
jgi:hypothetical protein